MVGRDAELDRLAAFVGEPDPGGTLVLVGGPGIGKTTLWEAAVASAVAGGVRVLAARSPVGAEAELPYVSLIDLCDRVHTDELAALPAVQRRALETVLGRAEGEPAAPGVIALGLLALVRAAAGRGPVMVAIDDFQWSDPASSEALAFIARRAAGARFLLARRPGRPGPLELVLARRRFERMHVGPLSLGAVRQLLFDRLGLTLSRHRLRRLVDATGGNPLYALEIGRALLEAGGFGEREPVLPDSLEEVLGDRVARLPASVRCLLLALALSEDPRTDQLVAIVGERALDDALDADAVVLDGQRVRASHPLLAASAERRSPARERRAMHLALAEVARDAQARAVHLACATTAPDVALATEVAVAAEAARARGARGQAALLASHALRLTPLAAGERPERVIELAGRLDDAGELRRMTAVLEEELGSLPAGPLRARAWLHLSEGERVRSRMDQDRYLERALSECGADQDLRAQLLAKLAGNAAAAGVSNLGRAAAWAVEALNLARDPAVSRYALWSLAWARGLTGAPLDQFCAQSAVAADPSGYISASPERVAAYRLVWRGELAAARASLESLLALSDERGDLTSYAMVRMHAVELELRAGNLSAAGWLLDEWLESSDYETQFRPQYPRCRALLEASRGAAAEARRWATDTIELARAAGSAWDELEARRALGIAALAEPAPDEALAELDPVWAHCEREGVLEPGAFPVAAELVEALVMLERLDEALAVTHVLRDRAARLDHPWARATAGRCAAVIQLAEGDAAGAAASRGAAGELDRLGFRFDAARCQLSLGRAQRRAKRWREARESLEQAIALFRALGAHGWAQRARTELDRVGGRRRADGELTPSERRVVELAAEGRSNKEIAAALYITVNTVEVHLARAYSKLGVSSRRQLAKRLAGDG